MLMNILVYLCISVEMFLFYNGTNSSSCGFTVTDTCNSFPKLLEVFHSHNFTNPEMQTSLKVFTNMSVTINKTLMVRDI